MDIRVSIGISIPSQCSTDVATSIQSYVRLLKHFTETVSPGVTGMNIPSHPRCESLKKRLSDFHTPGVGL